MSDTKDELKFTYGIDKGWWVKLWHKNRIIASVLGLSFDYARENAEEIVRRWNSQPDLLKACEGLMEKADNGSADFDDPTPDSIYLKAKAAIAKGSIQHVSSSLKK